MSRGPAREASDAVAAEQVRAAVGLAWHRAQRVHRLRWLAALSAIIWFQAWTHVPPDLLGWLAVLALGGLAVDMLAHAVREHRLAEQAPPAPSWLRDGHSSAREVASGLWYGVTVLGLPAAASVATGDALPGDVLTRLFLSAVAASVLAVTLETWSGGRWARP